MGLQVIVSAMESDGINFGQSIPVNIPGFIFPSDDYYENILPRIWPNAADVERADKRIRAFFNKISVDFSTHASDKILDTQTFEILKRFSSGRGNSTRKLTSSS